MRDQRNDVAVRQTHANTEAVAREGGIFSKPILLQYWIIVLRWKWVILSIVVASLAIGVIASLLMTPQYTATTRIEISREQKNVTKVEGLDSPQANRDVEFYQTQYSLLSARSLAERVERRLKLSSNADFFKALGANVDRTSFFDRGDRPLTREERSAREALAVQLLLKHVEIAPIRNSSLTDVRFTSGSAALSAQIANTWVEQFVQSTIDRRFSSTVDARRFLEGRLAELRGKLETSERDLVNYAQEKRIVALGATKGADGRTEVDRTLTSVDLEALNEALSKAIADRLGAESRLAGNTSGQVSAEGVTGSSAVSSLRQRRAEVSAEYQKLLVQFEPSYPAARSLAEQIRSLDASIAREEARIRGSRSQEYTEASEREQGLRRQVETLKSQLGRQQSDSIQYNIYQRETDTNRQLYDALLQRYKEIGVTGIGANNIAIVDRATVPERPSAPNLLLNIALALMAGLGLAGLATLALEQIDEGVRDPGEVTRSLHLPLLGSVPVIQNGNAYALINDTKSMLWEAYLSIHSNLAFSTDHGVPKAFMVTSTKPAEGKSTTTWALAKVLSRTGQRVVIIDADMRSPTLHSLVGVTNDRGLSNYLAGDDNWDGLLSGTDSQDLAVMTAGPRPPSAAELLSGERMRQLVEHLLTKFDQVVIDSPPILGLADAPLLSRAVEGVVFVIEAENVALRGLRASLGRLQSVHAHVYGAVLTKLKQQQAGYGYGYDYGYGYGREDAEDADRKSR
ncbi:polysaccharide biosynthesis tyrosine autokinase (plasmid) [Sphingomonadaceae bacterium OTU29THOMA1]|nr:polysaccharide biosynthesis tyrosine autokinase [Sphingomonadaceae bacterium OTU29THOMA1]